jgi:hypothetical protein
MRLSLGLVAVVWLMSSAHAQAPGAPSEVAIGHAIICDTSEQAARYVTLRNSGSEAVTALKVVNTEANKETACGAAVVAFRRGETVRSARMNGKRVDVVKITVVALNAGAGWSLVPETEQYAIIPPPGIEA